jgi:hypothetical protein
MSKSNENVVMHNMSGTVGDLLVFRKQRGRMVACKRPARKERPVSVEQEKVRDTFRQSAIYAKRAMTNPDLKAEYEAGAKSNENAFNAAFRDAAKGPVFKDHLDHSGYSGLAGEIITVRVTDNFKVAAVKVTIFEGKGSLLETGQAVLSENGWDWIYTTTADSPFYADTVIRFSASDLPGNVTVKEIVL